MKLRMQQLFKAITTATNPGVTELEFECLKFLKKWRHDMRALCSLTCELSGHRQRGARPVRQMIDNTAARAWRHAVGAPLERGVRQHCAGQKTYSDFVKLAVHGRSSLRTARPVFPAKVPSSWYVYGRPGAT